MIIVPYESWHYSIMEPSEYALSVITCLGKDVDFSAELSACSFCYSLVHDGKIEAVFGFMPMWRHVAETFAFISKDFKLTKERLSTIKAFIYMVVEELDIIRLQASAEYNNKQCTKFLEILDFELEGVMKKYGPSQEDYALYARII